MDIDQSPIGRTPRSNPATYTGLFNEIRNLFASTQEAKARGYGPGRFSFNVQGGRCEACCGDGMLKIEMHFLPDVYVPCEVCKGKRYNRETLEVRYKGKNIYDVLEMTVEEALEFFADPAADLPQKLQTLCDVGLGYVKLGQSSTTLSGGEAQRVKLATELSKQVHGQDHLYPGRAHHRPAHRRRAQAASRCCSGWWTPGNTVLVIEHNLDVIKSADYLIDLGPEGGDGGGTMVCTGTPEDGGRLPGVLYRPVPEKIFALNQGAVEKHVSVIPRSEATWESVDLPPAGGKLCETFSEKRGEGRAPSPFVNAPLHVARIFNAIFTAKTLEKCKIVVLYQKDC